MTISDRRHWDARYTYAARTTLNRGPDSLLLHYTPLATNGARALELACGLGHNARWLAWQGYRVDAIDISVRALRQARQAMLRQPGAGVHFIAADLDNFPLPARQYDLVVVFRFLDRRLFPQVRARVRPGGLVIYQTLNTGALARGTVSNLDHVLECGELPTLFPGWHIVHADDGPTMSAYVGRKPGVDRARLG